MAAKHHAPVHIPAAQHSAPLSAQQKKFNRHIERINQQRELLADWQLAIASYRERHAREFMPQQDAYRALIIELVQYLDAASDNKKLTKADRRTLSEAITDRLAVLIDTVGDEAMRASLKQIYNRHSGSDYDAEEAEGNDIARDMAQAMAKDFFGVDVDLEGANMDSPEDFLRRLQEQLQAQQERQEQAEAEREARRAARPRKPSARERKAKQEAAQATQSVREIYRKLASHLHPDRETDPTERERKTALMQRVNQAYQDNKLLDLLQLQLEVEQIDPEHIASLSEERLSHYNRVLAEQLRELQQEVGDVQDHFQMEFGLDILRSGKPAGIMRELRSQLQIVEYENLRLRKQVNQLRDDPAALKPWIKAERQQQKAQQYDMDDLDDWL